MSLSVAPARRPNAPWDPPLAPNGAHKENHLRKKDLIFMADCNVKDSVDNPIFAKKNRDYCLCNIYYYLSIALLSINIQIFICLLP